MIKYICYLFLLINFLRFTTLSNRYDRFLSLAAGLIVGTFVFIYGPPILAIFVILAQLIIVMVVGLIFSEIDGNIKQFEPVYKIKTKIIISFFFLGLMVISYIVSNYSTSEFMNIKIELNDSMSAFFQNNMESVYLISSMILCLIIILGLKVRNTEI